MENPVNVHPQLKKELTAAFNEFVALEGAMPDNYRAELLVTRFKALSENTVEEGSTNLEKELARVFNEYVDLESSMTDATREKLLVKKVQMLREKYVENDVPV